MSGIIVCTGGNIYKIVVGATVYYFEDHRYCGPMPVHRKTYEPRDLDFCDKFWWAVSLWYQQGKKVGRTVRDGVKMCDWRRPPKGS